MGNKLPANFETEFSKMIAETSVKLEKVMKNISENVGSKIKKKNPKNVSLESNYEEHVVMEIVNRAMTKVFESNSSPHIPK
jgi:hypothetical protein